MDNTTHIPELRFPEFEGEWVETQLGNISTDISYGIGSAAKPFDGVNKYLRITDIDDATHSFVPNPLTSPSGEIDSKYILQPGDVTFARTGASVGKTYLYNSKDGHLIYAGFLIKMSFSTTTGKFISFITQQSNYRKWVSVMSMRSGQPGINAQEYKSFKVSLPSPKEQQKIATFLTAIDQRIELLREKKLKLVDYKKGVMQKLFPAKGEMMPELRFKDDAGRDFPDWEEKRLGDVLEIGSGKDYKHLNIGEIPVYGTGGYMTSVDEFLYDGESVGIGRKGTIDKPMLLKGKFWTVDTLFYTHSFKNVRPFFVYILFQQINWKKHNEASGVPSLSKSTIGKITVNLPSVGEQNRIVSFLSSIDDKIEKINEQIDDTAIFKKGLLQKMFV